MLGLYRQGVILLIFLGYGFLQVKIAMVGKYTGLSDSYLSVLKVG